MEDNLHAMRHSLAHIMASATQQLWPEVRLGVGPVVENGFYYDIDLGGKVTLSEEDFEKIEAKMREIIKADEQFVHSEKSIDEAIKWAKDSKQPYKEELLNDLKRAGTTIAKDLSPEELGSTLAPGQDSKVDKVGFYTNGPFTDLCRGPHVASTGKVGAFKLMRVAGAYWRGDETKAQMQRLYGVAFGTQDQLDEYLEQIEEAKRRDHRKLGKELDIYATSDMIGSGLPVFTPRGTLLRDLLGAYTQQLRTPYGYKRVWSPHITKKELYEASGHWAKFGDELFLVKSQETSDTFAMKPMNCPHHSRIYVSQPRSYKDLPIKYMENATCYRDEKSGELHGLSRVRAFTQDDCHTYCMPSQVEQVATELVDATKEMYKTLDMELIVELSFRDDSDNYLGSQEGWKQAQEQLEAVAQKNGLDYKIVEGEAAFYGPKIDFRVKDAIGRTWQTATVQIDFVQPSPERFNLQYTDESGSKQNPLVIHSTLLGSLERFLSVYIEHVAGRFPFWLAPEQIRILTVNDSVGDYVKQITDVLDETVLMKPLKYNELRYEIDDSKESLGKKIRNAEGMKIPVVLIVGPKDQTAGEVSVRTSEGESKIALNELGDYLKNL